MKKEFSKSDLLRIATVCIMGAFMFLFMFGTNKKSSAFSVPGGNNVYFTDTEANTTTASGSGDINEFSVSMDENGNISTSFDNDTNSTSTWATIYQKSKGFIVGFAGLGTIIFLFFFIKNILAVGAASGNPQRRSEALIGVLWTGIAAAGCGSVTVIAALFWNALK